MREKKLYTVITFATTTAAMMMEARCGEKNIPGRLIPVPQSITASCGLAWRIPANIYPEYREQMSQLGVPFEKITEVIL
jgi:hypothetical protein